VLTRAYDPRPLRKLYIQSFQQEYPGMLMEIRIELAGSHK